MMERFFLISLFFLLPLLGSAQSQLLLDSLQVELNDAETDFDKAEILIQISRLYMSTDVKLSINYAEEAIEVLDRDKQTSAYANSNRVLGNALLTAGSYSQALDYFFKGLNVAVEIEDNFEQFATAYLLL